MKNEVKFDINDISKELLALKKRSMVLKYSLVLESNISDFLGILLKIKPGSKSFGSSTKYALSFNAKMYLMFDMDIIDSDEKNILETFMAIRNQFMHNLQTNTFEKCISYLSGKEKLSKKIITFKDELTLEENYTRAIEVLANTSVLISFKVLDEAIENAKKEGQRIADTYMLETYHYTFTEVYNKATASKTDSVSLKEMQQLFTKKLDEYKAMNEKADYSGFM